MASRYCCPDCALPFSSRGLMEKHQVNFCVGPEEVEDSSSQQMLHAKVDELQRLKQRKAELRKEREQREDKFLNRPDETSRNSGESENLWEQKSAVLLRLQKQEELKKEKREFDLNPQSPASSVSIHLSPTPEIPTDRTMTQMNRSEETYRLIQMEAEIYNQKVERHRQKTKELISQKQAIENRLKDFERVETPKAPGGSTVLLDQLQMRQEQNQMALMRLQQQQPIKPDSKPNQGDTKDQDYLLKEINAVRQRYLDSGGNNPEILIDIVDMEKDALELLERQAEFDHATRENKEKCKILDEEIEAFEIENRQLQDDLIRLHETNTEKLEFQVHSYDEDAAEELISARKRQQEREIERIEHELELANQEAKLSKIKKRLENLGIRIDPKTFE